MNKTVTFDSKNEMLEMLYLLLCPPNCKRRYHGLATLTSPDVAVRCGKTIELEVKTRCKIDYVKSQIPRLAANI